MKSNQKNDQKLLKQALLLGMSYAKKQGYHDLGPEITEKHKVECIYRLLVEHKQITPLAIQDEDGPKMKNKLVLWIKRLLPKDHKLLQSSV
jgi:hypothetical protein